MIYLLILASPITTYFFPEISRVIELWMLATMLGVALFFRPLSSAFHVKHSVAPLIFLTYVAFTSFLSFYNYPSGTIFRLGLFILTFLLFLAVENLNFKLYNQVLAQEWWGGIRWLLIFVCSYGIYQFVARIFNLPFDGSDIYRGRVGIEGNINQVSSFFEEPAFLCLLLVAAFYIILFVNEKIDWLLVSLILITVVLSRSMGGLLSCAILFGIYFLSTIVTISIRGMSRRNILAYLSLPLVLFIIYLFFDGETVIDQISNRLESEVLSSISLIGLDPFEVGNIGSGGLRLINEFNWLLFTLGENPFFGFGISYSEIYVRTTALNAIAEIVIRWGIIGLFLIISLIVLEKRRYSSRSRLSFWVFLGLYFFMDGAIAKIEFWLPLAIVFLAERLRIQSYNSGKLTQ